MPETKSKKVVKAKKTPKNAIERKVHNLDAEGKILGRFATEIAQLLRGKNKVNFRPHIDSGDIVNVTNISKIKLSGKKIEQKEYKRHSGYPGGLKVDKAKRMEPAKMLKRAVYYMLPKNKLRAKMMRRLNIKN